MINVSAASFPRFSIYHEIEELCFSKKKILLLLQSGGNLENEIGISFDGKQAKKNQ
jgi:hypothetical protein